MCIRIKERNQGRWERDQFMSFCMDYKVIFLQGKGPPSKREIARAQLAEKKS